MSIEVGASVTPDTSPAQRPSVFSRVFGCLTRVDADDEVASYRVRAELGPHHGAVQVPVIDGDLLAMIQAGHRASQAEVEAARLADSA